MSKPGCAGTIFGAVIGTLLGACLLVFNIISVCGIVSGARVVVDSVTGQLPRGTITDASSHTVHSNRGPDETYCFGTISTDDGTVRHQRVRIYQKGYCFKARHQEAIVVRGLFTPISLKMVDPDDSAMAFNGLFGMMDGAVLSWSSFAKGLWPFGFMLPLSVLGDIGVVAMINSRRRRRQS